MPKRTLDTYVGILILTCALSLSARQPAAAQNAVPNGNFEMGLQKWESVVYQGPAWPNGYMASWDAASLGLPSHLGSTNSSVAYDASSSTAMGVVDTNFNDVATFVLQPNTTYNMGGWVKTVGSGFDGPGGADQWQKLGYAKGSDLNWVQWSGRENMTMFSLVENQIDWTEFSTTITTGASPEYVRLGSWTKFAANQQWPAAYTQIDDMYCAPPGPPPPPPPPPFTLHVATWYSGANGAELFNVPRWQQDIVSMKKLGLDGVWMVNVAPDLNPDCRGLSWNETYIAKLRQELAFAESQNMKVIITLAYAWPLTATWLVNDLEFQDYTAYVDRIVRETRAYSNVLYGFCNELMWPSSLYADAPSSPALVQHFRVWCYNQNTDVNYWNTRWGTTYTWSTLVPGRLWQGNTNRQNDHMRWLNAMTQPRLAQLGNQVKGLAPNAELGWHDTFNQYYGDVTNPANSPLATTNKFDFISTNGYGGLNTVTSNLSRIRQFFPSLPAFIGELGNRTTIPGWPQYPNGDEPFLCKPYLEAQQVGYNWWSWQGYPSGSEGEEAFGFVDQNGNRLSAFSLLPRASQMGTIRGKLTDSFDPSKVMRDITVSAGGVDVVSIWGNTGTVKYDDTYRIDLDPGTYTVTIDHPLYQPVSIPGVVVTAGQDITVDIVMQPRANMLQRPGFEGGLSEWVINTISGGGGAWLSIDNAAHPGWSLTDAHEGSTYLVMGAQPSPGKVEAYQDVPVQPDTTYRLSWWERALGSKFDGWWQPPFSADQWLTVSVDQKQGEVWGGPQVVLQQVQDQTDWKLVNTAFRTAPGTDTVHIRFDTKMVSGQDFLSGYPCVGIDSVLLSTYGEQLVETGIGAAKGLPDGTLVAASGTGTTNFGNYAYIEDPARCSAIQILGLSPVAGYQLAQQRVIGYLAHDIATGERQIVDQLGVQLTHTDSVSPIYLTNRSVTSGGGDVPGLQGAPGANTTGLLVKVFGRVTERRNNYIIIDDGSGAPIRVTEYGTTPSWVGVGTYVQVVGNVSVYNVGGTRVWCIRVPWWYQDYYVSWRVN